MAGKSKPASKPSRRYRQFTDRRLEILRSAADVFTRSGFTRATMGEIAVKVQMAKGSDFADLFLNALKQDRS